MAKILIIDSEPLNLNFAMRCVEAGHFIYWHYFDKSIKDVGLGVYPDKIKHIDNWISIIKDVDITVNFQNEKYLNKLDFFRTTKGCKIFSPSQKSADLEIKREVGLKFLESHGIKCPAYRKFKTIDEAEAFLRTDKGRYVMKSLGDEDDKSLSYCSKDAADLIEHLHWLKKNKIEPKDTFILQEFIKGTEFAVNAWVGAKGFIGKFGESFEHKALASGEKGPATGEMGTVQKYVESSVYADTVLKPLEADLVKLGHIGSIDVNSIITDDGTIHPLEFTARFGYPQWMIQQNLHEGDPVQWMIDACDGKDTLQVKMDTGLCVVLVVGPFPFENHGADTTRSEGLPIYGVNNGNKKHLIPQFAKMGMINTQSAEGGAIKKEKGWVTASTYYMVVNALGDSIEQCRTRVYKTIDQLHTPGSFYRDDIGEKVVKWLDGLHKNNFAKEFKK